jgi:hypothetical protein
MHTLTTSMASSSLVHLFAPLQRYAASSLQLFDTLVPGATEDAKKEWCTRVMMQTLEAMDGHVPLVGALLDTPIADAVERRLVERLVDRVLRASSTRGGI